MLEELQKQHEDIEAKVFDYSLELMRPWYEKRRDLVKQIENFWPVAIEKSELLANYITYEDSEVLDCLRDLFIEWDLANSKNYTITMEFASNKYFDGCVLSKKFVQSEQEPYSEPVSLDWKSGMDLTKPVKGRDESFFKWFGETKEAAFEIGQILAEDLFPHALNYYNYNEGDEDLEEYDISEDD